MKRHDLHLILLKNLYYKTVFCNAKVLKVEFEYKIYCSKVRPKPEIIEIYI